MSSIARNENESFEDYKARRAADDAATKKALKPKMFHDSYYDGIYINDEKNAYKAHKASFSSFRQFKKATRKGGK